MTGDLANHLWQSTVFAAGAGLLTLLVRRNHARVRYWLWFAASVKFLVPFALLGGLVSQVDWASQTPQPLSRTVEVVAQINEPFSGDLLSAAPVPSASDGQAWESVLFTVWGLGLVAIAILRWRLWRRIRGLARISAPMEIPAVHLPAAIPVRSAPGIIEPGVIGIFRPIVLLPAGIQDHLPPHQLHAVLAHELCHVRRRDNLTAAIHMVAEGVFWFHPLVWWIGGRLVEARERACDEDVLRELGDPEAYAESILNVCKMYLRAPLVCVSGVSGADLRTRLDAIVANRMGRRLTAAQTFGLVAAGLLGISLPVAVGAIPAPASATTPVTQSFKVASITFEGNTPAFEVASVRRSLSGAFSPPTLQSRPGGAFTATNQLLARLIAFAYRIEDFRLVGGPAWIRDTRFDVQARAATDVPNEQLRLMVQALLENRFGLVAHKEQREMPVYSLVLARTDGRLGSGLRPVDDCEAKPPGSSGPNTYYGCGGVSVAAAMASMTLGAPVVDKTGLTGTFDVAVTFSPEGVRPFAGEPFTPAADSNLPSFRDALRDQLGLALEPGRGPVEVLVIDSVEMPTPN